MRKHPKPQLGAIVMELFILGGSKDAPLYLPLMTGHHQLQSVAERAEGTQRTGRTGSQLGRQKTKGKNQPTYQKHPTGDTLAQVSMDKPQCLWIPVIPLKELRGLR